MAVVYLATNKITGERYIGATKWTLDRRRKRHLWAAATKRRECYRLNLSLRRHGTAAFEWCVLVELQSADEAFAEERRLVAELRPELNVSAGGRNGWSEEPWTTERRAEMSRKCLGRKPSVATIEANRTRGLQNRAIWIAGYAKLGPRAIARRVECLDDGKLYESGAAAAAAYGVAASALRELCLGQRGRQTVGGLRFRYVEVDDGLR